MSDEVKPLTAEELAQPMPVIDHMVRDTCRPGRRVVDAVYAECLLATIRELQAENARLLERMFQLCRDGRVASGCVDTSHAVGWNACITWMESALCAVKAALSPSVEKLT